MRTSRKQSSADICHVVARGAGRQLIFEDDRDRGMFMELFEDALERTGVDLYAWCLMGNRVHLLVHAPIERVSGCMKLLLGRYSQWFNAKAGRVGHLFQERFKSEPVDTDAYLVTVVRYIHENFEKAGLGSRDAYLWSSYREYLGEPCFCKTDFVLEASGGAWRRSCTQEPWATTFAAWTFPRLPAWRGRTRRPSRSFGSFFVLSLTI